MLKQGDHRRHSLFEMVLLTLPFIIYSYPAAALLTAKSSTPVFYFYSSKLLLLNVLTILLYGAFLYGLIAGWRVVQFGTLLFLAALTLVATNNSVLHLRAFEATTQLTRMFAGLALIVIVFLSDKQGRSRFSGYGVGIGAIIIVTGAIDFGFASILKLLQTDKANQIYGQHRTAYDLTKIADQDIVLIGDSFVWGAGVPVDQRFGDVLERRLNAEAKGPRVYSLGVVGANVAGYIQQIQDLPATSKVRQIVLCFYANDMPPRGNLQDTLQQVAVTIGRQSITFRVIAEFFEFLVTPNTEAYAKLLLTHYVEDDATFDLRWRQLEREFEKFFRLAVVRSHDRPMILVLPMLVDFDKAAFDGPMRRVSNLAEGIGFLVVDTMPAFRAEGEKAEGYRAAPNDLHLNERGNGIVAEVLFGALTDTPPIQSRRPDQEKP